MSSTTITDEHIPTGEREAAPRAESKHALAVSIQHLSKTYPMPLARLRAFFRRPSKPAVEALRDVSFEVREGEIFGLIGRNGAGKTTLTKIVATLVQPTSGAVTVKGYDSVHNDERVRSMVGLATAEERSFYWRLTVEQNLIFFARLYGLGDGEARRRIAELLARLELEELARRRFGELSTGNKQRMAVARALIAAPPVLLLDEPTRSLDPLAAARMRSFISSLAAEHPPVSILLTSHNLVEVEELCARVAIIRRGQIRAVETPANLRALNHQTERVCLTVRGINIERARRALTTELDDVEVGEQDGRFVIAFTRETGDDRLDVAVRVLHLAGAVVVACDAERSTLLDVLESYEREHEAESEER